MPYIEAHPACVNRDYYQVLKRFRLADPPSLRGLFDNHTLQAAASVYLNQDGLFLSLLLTAPWRKKGSGSTLLRQIVEECDRLGGRGKVDLMSAPSAIGFYLKYGFQIISPPKQPGWDTHMRLTAAAAQAWLSDSLSDFSPTV